MKSENRFANETQLPSEPLSEPHFDEEATLLSARPVVPLNDSKARAARSKGRLFFALAIVISLLFGASSAILIGYLRPADEQVTDNLSARTREPTSLAPEPGNVVSSSGEAGASLSESNPTASARRIGEPTSSLPNVRKSRPAKDQVPHDLRGAVVSSPSSAAMQNEVPHHVWDGREANRERSEARRRRRETPRKSRKNSDESSDELLRITEIFEGMPRP